MPAITEKQLFQSRISGTSATLLFSFPALTNVVIRTITVCNTTAGAKLTFRIFHDDNGTTYDETTALFFDEAIAANTTRIIDCFIAGTGGTGNIAGRTSTSLGLTFTGYGWENI